MPKRRRKDSFGQAKRHKYNGLVPAAAVVNHTTPSEPQKKGKRHRPRTKNLRKILLELIEGSLSSGGERGRAVREQIHYNPETDERPYIYLHEFLAASVEVTEELRAQIGKITKEGLLKMNNLTTIFKLEEDPATGQLIIYCEQTASPDECTVYITNLPRDTNALRLHKLTSKFGSLAEATFSLKNPRNSYDLIRPKFYKTAIIQFTEADPAQEMLKKYAANRCSTSEEKNTRQPKPHRRRWRKIVWRDAMISKRKYEVIRKETEKTETSNGKTNSYGQKNEEHRRRSGSGLKKNKLVVRKKSRAGKEMFNIDWPALRKRLKERKKRRNYRKKKRLMERKAKRARAIAEGRTPPKRIRLRRRRRLRDRSIHGSIDHFFSTIQVYTGAEYFALQAEYRRLQQSRLAEKVAEYKTATDNEIIDLVKETRQREFIEEYVDQCFGEPPTNSS